MGASQITVAVCGALGRMGSEAVKAILQDSSIKLVGAADRNATGQDAAIAAGLPSPCGVTIANSLDEMLSTASETPQVCVDFTHPDSVFANAQTLIAHGVRPVIGTTGLKPEQLEALRQQLEQLDLGGMVIPNFAIGAILLMKFAKEAAQYFDHAEIIELHHNRKADAPSGTSIKTAQLMSESCAQFGTTNQPEKETITGARGATTKAGIHIHSVRLPGLLAHEEVLLGGPGQLLTLRHDSFDRTCFMPGVLLCIKKVVDLSGLVYGMEEIL